MAESLLALEISDRASIAYSSLGQEDQRLLDAWFDHLRNWRNDEFVRSKSKRLSGDDEVFVFQTNSDLVIAFKIVGDTVTVLSIFRKEALRLFETTAERAS